MKRRILKLFMLKAFLAVFLIPVFSQDGDVKIYTMNEDSTNCPVVLSVFREFFRPRLFEHAIEPWRILFDDCPAFSEQMYVDGVTMYRSFIEASPDGPVKEGLIDTLMLIYDRRMEYFGGEGNVIGRKGRDLLAYRGTVVEQVQEAFEMLKRSIALEGENSQEAVMLLTISAGITLKKEDKLNNNQLIEAYLMVTGILDRLEDSSSRWERTRATIDEIMLKEDILTCESLNLYFEPQFEQNRNDETFLGQVIRLYNASGCERSDIYLAASENLYKIVPGPESAHNLAILYITRDDFQMAAGYLREALQGENIDRETRSTWYYELAVVSSAVNDHCGAIEYARESLSLKNDNGKAYILLGDAYIASRESLGDDFQQRTAFWAAVDKYTQAASVDPSVAAEATQKLSDYAGQYPSNEEVFFHDIKEGDPYLVGGCINEQTTVRSSD